MLSDPILNVSELKRWKSPVRVFAETPEAVMRLIERKKADERYQFSQYKEEVSELGAIRCHTTVDQV